MSRKATGTIYNYETGQTEPYVSRRQEKLRKAGAVLGKVFLGAAALGIVSAGGSSLISHEKKEVARNTHPAVTGNLHHQKHAIHPSFMLNGETGDRRALGVSDAIQRTLRTEAISRASSVIYDYKHPGKLPEDYSEVAVTPNRDVDTNKITSYTLSDSMANEGSVRSATFGVTPEGALNESDLQSVVDAIPGYDPNDVTDVYIMAITYGSNTANTVSGWTVTSTPAQTGPFSGHELDFTSATADTASITGEATTVDYKQLVDIQRTLDERLRYA